jgi:hypothetical protein
MHHTPTHALLPTAAAIGVFDKSLSLGAAAAAEV